MKKLFSKDECAPDAQTLRGFQIETKIGLERDHFKPGIDVFFQDWRTDYFVDKQGRFLKEEYFCGVYESFYQFDSEEEYQTDIRDCLLEHCKMDFLKL